MAILKNSTAKYILYLAIKGKTNQRTGNLLYNRQCYSLPSRHTLRSHSRRNLISCVISRFFSSIFFLRISFFSLFSVVFIIFLCFSMVKLLTDSVLELTAPSKLVLRPLMNWRVRFTEVFC